MLGHADHIDAVTCIKYSFHLRCRHAIASRSFYCCSGVSVSRLGSVILVSLCVGGSEKFHQIEAALMRQLGNTSDGINNVIVSTGHMIDAVATRRADPAFEADELRNQTLVARQYDAPGVAAAADRDTNQI
jgi:hypothetical protein